MKTTIEINDVLLKETKRLALERNLSLKAIVEAALRRFLEESKAQTGAGFKLRRHTFGGRGLQPGLEWHEWEKMRALIYEGRGG